MPGLEAYSRELVYSYAPGLFPCMEAVNKRSEWVTRVLIASSAHGEGIELLKEKCAEKRIRTEIADKALSRISGKDNCYAAAVFIKKQSILEKGNHIVLHHISDAGNLGTILRTALGFGYHDIAVIRPSTDPFNPHTVRASMGALFSLRLKEYDTFDEYRNEYPDRDIYPFMLTGSVPLEEASGKALKAGKVFSLVFGNEGAGLPDEFSKLGVAVRIRQSDEIDSLNLAVAAAVGMYTFSGK